MHGTLWWVSTWLGTFEGFSSLDCFQWALPNHNCSCSAFPADPGFGTNKCWFVMLRLTAVYVLEKQTFVSGDVLRRQYSDKLPPEPHISSFKKASINNALPDPDIPQGYDPDTPEYVCSLVSLSQTLCRQAEQNCYDLSWSCIRFSEHLHYCLQA
jgi:hypothetical protein